jgi:7,8-dihydropterin-6-yl-methyl-4-(beta-D-ribofuranosyl)aminobenzene 5'-phosphate synthase
MDGMIRITVLVDNTPGAASLTSEHGLAFWIEADGMRILFDTAQGPTSVIDNARHLGIDIATADAVVLSHGHYDHSGGLAAVLALNPTVPLYCHPGCTLPRYSRQADGTLKVVVLTNDTLVALDRHSASTHWVSTPCMLSAAIGLTGPIARIDPLEDTGGAFFLDEQATRPDLISDDMAIWIRTRQGSLVICGCCHSGIVNTLGAVAAVSNEHRVAAVVGGLHLLHASGQRLEHTFEFLHRVQAGALYTAHCTGEGTAHELDARFVNNHRTVVTGMCMVFEG